MPNFLKVFERTPFPGVLKGYEGYTASKKSRYSKTCETAAAGVYTALHMYRCIQVGRENYIQESIGCDPATYSAGIGTGKRGEHIAEITMEANTVDIVVVTQRGIIYGGRKNLETGTISRLGTESPVFLLALMPRILSNPEANEAYMSIENELLHNPLKEPLINFELNESMFHDNLAVLTSNIMHRMLNKDTDDNIAITMPNTVKFNPLIQEKIEGGSYAPDRKTERGVFRVLSENRGRELVAEKLTLDTFCGSYRLSDRILTDEEEKMVPKFNGDWNNIPEAVTICEMVKKSSDKPEPRRNFMMCGPSGTGKTIGSAIVAAGLHLPKVRITCSAGSEIFDFLGQIFPVGSTEKVELPELIKKFDLPSVMDVHYDLKGSYRRLTDGLEIPAGVDELEVLTLLMQKTALLAQECTSGGSGFVYQDTDFIKAMKYGWLVELQEPSVIVQPGVLPGLNSLLDCEKMITLPTGERIHRHPETVVIVTTNVDYRGCEEMNNSVISRMHYVFHMENPDYQEMAVRAMKRSGYQNKEFALEMARIVQDISKELTEKGIDDGVCGQRELNDWMSAVDILGEDNILECAKNTVIAKATFDASQRRLLFNAHMNSTLF